MACNCTKTKAARDEARKAQAERRQKARLERLAKQQTTTIVKK